MIVAEPKYCFVAMPFRPELNFFFLYVKDHLERHFPLLVERGDADVLTKPLIEKIRGQILRADLVIGDITGDNPNVFYEIGLAHAAGKPVIFLTQDPPERAPVDVRQFECVHYDLARHVELLGKLDSAVRQALGPRYQDLYQRAVELLERFNQETGLKCEAAPIDDFDARVRKGEQTGGIPRDDHEDLLVEFVLPKIIAGFDDKVAKEYTRWIGRPRSLRRSLLTTAGARTRRRS